MPATNRALRRAPTAEQTAYYRVSPRNRLLVASVYVGLVVLLALGMDLTHILGTGAHSFRTL